jgi:choline dehydrogenase-like flavoprotein
MARSLIPLAEQAGARFQTGCRVKRFEFKGARITAVLFERTTPEGAVEPGRVEAGHVFLCAGPTQTPWLLLRNGIKKNVGRSLQIHPMVKVIARFEERIDAENSVMPLIQVSEFWPETTLGGSYYSTGQLAMLLGENWPGRRHLMDHCDRMGAYYAVVKGKSKGRVRPSLLDPDQARISYGLHRDDHRNLKFGLSKLCQLLLAAGAAEVFPAIHGLGPIRTREEAERLGNQAWPAMDLPITTVHAFAACPAGERDDYCAADSFGRVRGLDNLYLGDASMIPESPSVNPQAGIMALAHRNVLRFLAERL